MSITWSEYAPPSVQYMHTQSALGNDVESSEWLNLSNDAIRAIIDVWDVVDGDLGKPLPV